MFDEASVRARIASTRFTRLVYTQETDSTNDDASRMLGDERPEGTIVLAELQRSGRGRRGRRWVAPAGSSLLFTAIVPRTVHTSGLWAVPFWCALEVAAGVQRSTGIALSLQWPNDLLLGGRKACGILSTSRVIGDEARVACGIGLNVLRPAAAAGVAADAAFLSDATSRISREDVFVAIVGALDASLARLDAPTTVAREWERRAGLPGALYRIQIDDEPAPFECRALRLAPDGGLVVVVDGRERRVSLGDARALR